MKKNRLWVICSKHGKMAIDGVGRPYAYLRKSKAKVACALDEKPIRMRLVKDE